MSTEQRTRENVHVHVENIGGIDQTEIEHLETERRQLDDQLKELDDLKQRLPDLEAKRQRLDDHIDEKRDELAAKDYQRVTEI